MIIETNASYEISSLRPYSPASENSALQEFLNRYSLLRTSDGYNMLRQHNQEKRVSPI